MPKKEKIHTQPRTKIKNEKKIENICPIKGVTPEQLFNHSFILLFAIKQSHQLIDDEKLEAIHDAVITTIKKMDDGIVPKFIYDEFKYYFYRTLVNSINKKITNADLKKNKIFKEYLPIGNYDVNEHDFEMEDDSLTKLELIEEIEGDDEKISKLKRIHDAINELPSIEKEIFLDYINGLKIREIVKKYGVLKSRIFCIETKLKIKLKLYRKPKPMEKFPRHEYYSQIEILKKFKISYKKFKQLLIDNNIPVVSNEANLGHYKVNTCYVLKRIIDNLNIPLR